MVKNPKIGEIFVYWDDKSLVKCVSLEGSHLDMTAVPGNLARSVPALYDFLMGYHKGVSPEFTPDILDMSQMGPFMRKVYETLFYVPRGTLVTYGELAEMSGFPNAYRAVGTAMRKNIFTLVLPCHRVVGVNSLGGFTVGMGVKLKLLRMEGIKV